MALPVILSIAIRVMMTRLPSFLPSPHPNSMLKPSPLPAGNQTPDKTLRNVLRMLTLLQAPGYSGRRRRASSR